MKQVIIYLTLHILSIISCYSQSYPYSTNNDNLTIWNGETYTPFFIKGINLGISVPGTFPGELAATEQQYLKWFNDIKSAGFNCIRLYTLHFPHFYKTLETYNNQNPQNPLLFFQGVWLNEEVYGYSNDLYFLTDTFKIEISENIDCIHGNKTITHRYGKAYGEYTFDVSKWCLGYIIGREVYPEEILHTNNNNSETYFTGEYFSISNASASEVWFTEKLNYLVKYENNKYNTQRPVSISSWPTLDPIEHPEELFQNEDTVSIDLSKIDISNAKAGMFISYHAYPYYPDFVSFQSDYKLYSDNYGPNSYLGYLNDLKSHYKNIPLIIAEYGVPSSWGIAHYSSSGMNHGGFDETEQGNVNIRLLESIYESNCGGGIQFAIIDEWFKRTWITDELDYDNNARVNWHNITAAEQNFGIIGFKTQFSIPETTFFSQSNNIKNISTSSNSTFFKCAINSNSVFDVQDEIWICFDTYSDILGENILPTNDTIPYLCEFALKINKYSAQLFVTEAYDLFGRWHNEATTNQKFQSTKTTGKPWNIVRWKNNPGISDVQYIGNLKVNHDFQNPSSMDAVTFSDSTINIQIPWTLLQFTDPTKLKVCHDNKSTSVYEDTLSDGIQIAVLYKKQWYKTQKRYKWDSWTTPNFTEYYKSSYYIMQDNLSKYNTKAIATNDNYYITNNESKLQINATDGLIANDFDLDGNTLQAILISYPENGDLDLYSDGSFNYQPYENINEKDQFEYCIFDGYSLSNISTVKINNESTIASDNSNSNILTSQIEISPNPCFDYLNINSQQQISDIIIFNNSGKIIYKSIAESNNTSINVINLPADEYHIALKINNKFIAYKFIKS